MCEGILLFIYSGASILLRYVSHLIQQQRGSTHRRCRLLFHQEYASPRSQAMLPPVRPQPLFQSIPQRVQIVPPLPHQEYQIEHESALYQKLMDPLQRKGGLHPLLLHPKGGYGQISGNPEGPKGALLR